MEKPSADVLWAQLSKDTSSVVVKHSKEWGRYFIAAKDFKIDEPVHVEQAYLLYKINIFFQKKKIKKK